jgi:hypothetical protein
MHPPGLLFAAISEIPFAPGCPGWPGTPASPGTPLKINSMESENRPSIQPGCPGGPFGPGGQLLTAAAVPQLHWATK